MNETKKSEYKAAKVKQASAKKPAEEAPAAVEIKRVNLVGYRDIQVGCQLMGAVSEIGRDELIIDLPFNMIGHCPLAHCTASLPGKQTETDLLKMKAGFEVGQLVSCAVIDTGVTSGKHTKVTVSLLPEVMNAGMTSQNIANRMVVSAFVSSEEKHGYCLDMGATGLSGFLPKSDIPTVSQLPSESFDAQCKMTTLSYGLPRPIIPGSLVSVSVTGNKASVVKCSMLEAQLTSPIGANNEVKASLCRSGFLVTCKVTEVLPSGDCYVSFLKSLKGEIHRSYLAEPATRGQVFTARVIAVLPDAQFKLATLPHLVNWTRLASAGVEKASAEAVVTKAKVVDVVKGHCVRLTASGITAPLVCHYTRGGKDIAEEGKTVSCRVIGSNMLDGTFQVSADPKVVSATAVVSVAGIEVGQVFANATVDKVDHTLGVIVKLGDFITGRVPREHLTDVPTKKFPPSIQEGSKLKVRVLAVDKVKRQVTLTAKKMLVSDTGKIVTENSQAEAGDILTGYVKKVASEGKNTSVGYIHFYGEAYGVAKVVTSGADEEETSGLVEGHVARVRVTKTGKVLKLSTELSKPVVTEDEVGTIITSFKIKAASKVDIQMPGETRWLSGVIPEGHMSDLPTHLQLVPTKLVIIGQDKDGFMLLSAKPSLLAKAEAGTLSEAPVTGAFSTGYICRLEEKFALVSLGHHSTQGICMVQNMGDRFITDAKSMLKLGQSVFLKVLESKDSARKHFSVSMKKTIVAEWSEYQNISMSWLTASLSVDLIGQEITSFIAKSEKPYGKLFTAEDYPNWTILALNENYCESPTRLVVLDVMLDKKVLEVMCLQSASSGKRKAEEFTVKLTKDCYVVGASLDGSVVVAPRLKFDKEGVLEHGAAMKVKPLRQLNSFSLSVFTSGSGNKKARTELDAAMTKLEVGQIVNGTVETVGDDYLDVQVPGRRKTARLHVTELLPLSDWRDYPLSEVSVGTELSNLRVVSYKKKGDNSWISASTDALPATAEALQAQTQLKGYVVNSGMRGVFVAFSRDVSGRIQLKSMKPRPASEADIHAAYPVGKLLTNLRIVSVSSDGLIDLAPEAVDEIAALQPGLSVAVEVKNKQKYGAFLKILGTGVTALCPLVDLAVKNPEAVLEKLQIGQKLLAEITKVENGKVWASLKLNMPTDLPTETVDETAEIPMDISEESEAEQVAPVPVTPARKLIKEVVPKLVEQTIVTPASTIASPEKDVLEGSESESDDDKKAKRRAKKERKAERKQADKDLRATEMRNVEEDWRRDPQTVDDFERLLLSEGERSSVIWIKYMAWWMKMADVNKAREVAERAVGKIAAHEENDKFNLWLAYLNLEANFGNPAKLQAVFNRACQYCESKRVHQAMPDVYVRANDQAKALAAYEKGVTKFSSSRKSWLAYLEYLFTINQAEEARKQIPRAQRLLPKHKHVRLLTKMAQMEYRSGFLERGKTCFESLLANNPKRLDIWSIYLDEHIKAYTTGPKVDLAKIRELFDRAISMGLKPQKTKFFFRRWLEVEDEFGGEQGQAAVKERAKAYVQSIQGESVEDEVDN